MFRPNLLKVNARNVIAAILAFTILGFLSSCSKKGFDWWPSEAFSKIHFGGKYLERGYNNPYNKKHSRSLGKHDKKLNASDFGLNSKSEDSDIKTVLEPKALDLTYTYASK